MAAPDPHQWVQNHEAGDAAPVCRMCCQLAADAGPECVPTPGNPGRPFFNPLNLLAALNGLPLAAGGAIHSAPPEDDPVELQIRFLFANQCCLGQLRLPMRPVGRGNLPKPGGRSPGRR